MATRRTLSRTSIAATSMALTLVFLSRPAAQAEPLAADTPSTTASGHTFTAPAQWTVWIYDMADAVGEKRAAQVELIDDRAGIQRFRVHRSRRRRRAHACGSRRAARVRLHEEVARLRKLSAQWFREGCRAQRAV